MWHHYAPSRLALTLTIVLIISPYGECVKREDLMTNEINSKAKGLASTPAASPSQYVAPSTPPPMPYPPSSSDMSPTPSPTPSMPPPSDMVPTLSPTPPMPYPPSSSDMVPTLSPTPPMPYPPSSSDMVPTLSPTPPSDMTPTLSPTPPSDMVPTLSPTPPMLSPTPPSDMTPTLSPTPPVLSPLPISNVSPTPKASSPNGLQVGFYQGKCPDKNLDIEAFIASLVEAEFHKPSSTILPHLLRLQFHDCFVHGCDASILIDGASAEKNADANLSVKGYEFIEAVKTSIEAQCPDLVSCADIIAIATKYALKLAGGPDYPVQTGRRDGLVSNLLDVNLPSPTLTVDQTNAVFKAKDFTPEEMVVLLGCHTVGVAHCQFFQDRLYLDSNQFDPLMDPMLRNQLISTCPHGTISSNFTGLNQNSNPDKSHVFDNSFFNQILRQRGILPIDQALARDLLTSDIVLKLSLDANLFNAKLADAMVKLQAVEVLTGNKGEIRKVCSKFNKKR